MRSMRQKIERDRQHVGPAEVLRFILDVAALWSMALWGWNSFDGLARIVTAIGLPLLAAAAWAIFRVPMDPSPAPVAVPGVVRLALEFIFFGTAAVMLLLAGQPVLSVVFAGLVVAHYVIDHRRVRWLAGGPRS